MLGWSRWPVPAPGLAAYAALSALLALAIAGRAPLLTGWLAMSAVLYAGLAVRHLRADRLKRADSR